MRRLHHALFLLVLFGLVSCMAKTYRDEMQSEVDSLKTNTKNIDDRYNSKYEILSEKIKTLSSSFKDLEKSSSQNKADTDVLVEDLRTEIQTIKGNIEESNHNVSTSDSNINKAVADLGQRISELENKFGIVLSHLTKLQALLEKSDAKGDKQHEASSSDVSDYDTILKSITDDKDFDNGALKLKEFMSKYPSSTLLGNAQYWLAECYYAKGDFKKASQEFSRLAKSFPASDKKCAGLLKQGYSLEKLNQSDQAASALKEVVKQCPGSSEASLAKDRLSPKAQPAEKAKAAKKSR